MSPGFKHPGFHLYNERSAVPRGSPSTALLVLRTRGLLGSEYSSGRARQRSSRHSRITALDHTASPSRPMGVAGQIARKGSLSSRTSNKQTPADVSITEARGRGGVGYPRGLTTASSGPGSARGRDSRGRIPARGRRSRPGVGTTHFWAGVPGFLTSQPCSPPTCGSAPRP